MTKELSRDEQIKHKTLKIQLVMPYLTAMSIFFALFMFALGSSIYGQLEKLIVLGVLGIAMIAMFITYRQNMTDIDNIFKN